MATFISAIIIATTMNFSCPFNKEAEASPLYNTIPAVFEDKRKFFR